MGIPGLTSQLEKRGRPVTMNWPMYDKQDTRLPCPTLVEQGINTTLIIDGPGLAYYIYSEVQKSSTSSKWRMPQYHAYGTATVDFLDELELLGMRVEAIYFDGVLPASKLEERLSRTRKHARELRAALECNATLPTAPFLVPAVIEALCKSKYARMTQVKPAEAEDHCAMHARTFTESQDRGAIILTGDSDMFVLDCGRMTQIMLFDSLQRRATGMNHSYYTTVYCTDDIARSVGLANLLQVAYYMQASEKLSFIAAADKVRQGDAVISDDFTAFRSKYEAMPADSIHLPPTVSGLLQHMDPRVAEVAHQVLIPGTRGEENVIMAFLPALHEDVTRFSAWRVGQDLRRLAYRILLSHDTCGPEHEVHEYTRRGDGTGFVVQKHEVDFSEQGTPLLKELLEICWPITSSATPAQFYHYMGAAISLRYLRNYYAQRPLEYHNVLRILTRADPVDWFEVHVTAVTQAAIYSMRMLKQILELHQATHGAEDRDLMPLRYLMRDMPSIACMFERGEGDSERFWGKLAESLIEQINGDEDYEVGAMDTMSGNRGPNDENGHGHVDEHEGGDEDAEEDADADAGTMSNNPYSILAQ